MNVYREPGERPLPHIIVTESYAPVRGLVRANGVNCRCRPPGTIWCWWFEVKPKDRWICDHDGAWIRQESYGTGHFLDFWIVDNSTPTKGNGSNG